MAFARLLTGGVIVVATTVEQAIIAERFGARAVIIMDKAAMGPKNPRMPLLGPDPGSIRSALSNTMIPVIGRVRVGHTMEAKVMESCGVALIDESEVLTESSDIYIKKSALDTPCISGISNLEEALKRIAEGATMLRSRCADENTPNISDVLKHYQTVQSDITALAGKTDDERKKYAEDNGVPLPLVSQVVRLRRLPVPFIADGGIMLPMDVAMAMDLGYDGVIASQALFQAANPEKRMRALVLAAIHYKNPTAIASIAEDCSDVPGGGMPGGPPGAMPVRPPGGAVGMGMGAMRPPPPA
ncbi:Pyridoxal 5'-phosphate synthase subunit snz1 [Coemansia spiralis]|nr:Pyridoxal 5'-phosphate synthase subunit snz1 [Coemansia spiralis]